MFWPAWELKKSIVFWAAAGPSSELIWYSAREFFISVMFVFIFA